MENIVFRKATEKDMPQIIDLQTKIFNGEQKIPSGDISEFLARKPQCWCAAVGDLVIGAVAAWEEDNVMHRVSMKSIWMQGTLRQKWCAK